MPCMGMGEGLTEAEQQEQQEKKERALRDLERQILAGKVKVAGTAERPAFDGWAGETREGWCDACAYRTLSSRGSSALRMAAARTQGTDRRRMQAR